MLTLVRRLLSVLRPVDDGEPQSAVLAVDVTPAPNHEVDVAHQAVVLVHGMGEHIPMDTIKGLRPGAVGGRSRRDRQRAAAACHGLEQAGRQNRIARTAPHHDAPQCPSGVLPTRCTNRLLRALLSDRRWRGLQRGGCPLHLARGGERGSALLQTPRAALLRPEVGQKIVGEDGAEAVAMQRRRSSGFLNRSRL